MTKKIERIELSYSKDDSRFGRYDTFTISRLKEAIDEFALQYSLDANEVKMEFYSEDSSYYCDGDSYLTFTGSRWETDEEFEARKSKLEEERLKANAASRKSKAAAKARQDQKDLEEYERLKAKFDGA